jgi:excisionase family DNA binding protein
LKLLLNDRMVGTHVAAKKLRMPERTLRYHAARGTMPAYRVGKLWKFSLSSLNAYAEPTNGGPGCLS